MFGKGRWNIIPPVWKIVSTLFTCVLIVLSALNLLSDLKLFNNGKQVKKEFPTIMYGHGMHISSHRAVACTS